MTISPSYRPRLVVMVKEPVASRVKTRLGRDIGMTRAAWWYRHQIAGLIRETRDPRWQTILAVTPDRAGAGRRLWPAWPARVGQGAGDLGARMRRIFDRMPPGPVLIVGSDIPGIRKDHIARAFRRLGDHDAVLGPAVDGGYWLIGLNRRRATPPGLFHNVRWSTEFALSDTVLTLPDHRVAQIDRLRDVDTADDL